MEGPKIQSWLKVSHDLPSPSSYWLLGDPSSNSQLPIFGIQGAGVSARESEDLHKATPSLGGIFNGLVGRATVKIPGLSSFNQE